MDPARPHRQRVFLYYSLKQNDACDLGAACMQMIREEEVQYSETMTSSARDLLEKMLDKARETINL
jgi:hypothetical protein